MTLGVTLSSYVQLMTPSVRGWSWDIDITSKMCYRNDVNEGCFFGGVLKDGIEQVMSE